MAIYFGRKYIVCRCCIYKLCCFKKEKLGHDLAKIKKYEEQLYSDFNMRHIFDKVYEHHLYKNKTQMLMNVLGNKNTFQESQGLDKVTKPITFEPES